MLGQRHELERESVRRGHAILEFILYSHLIYIHTRTITFGRLKRFHFDGKFEFVEIEVWYVI